MIDDNKKVWLIEVNTNPCLELSSSHLARIIPHMIENALRLAIDPLFPPPEWPFSRWHNLPDVNDQNKFELVFNEKTDSKDLKNLPYHNEDALIGIIHEEDEEEG